MAGAARVCRAQDGSGRQDAGRLKAAWRNIRRLGPLLRGAGKRLPPGLAAGGHAPRCVGPASGKEPAAALACQSGRPRLSSNGFGWPQPAWASRRSRPQGAAEIAGRRRQAEPDAWLRPDACLCQEMPRSGPNWSNLAELGQIWPDMPRSARTCRTGRTGRTWRERLRTARNWPDAKAVFRHQSAARRDVRRHLAFRIGAKLLSAPATLR